MGVTAWAALRVHADEPPATLEKISFHDEKRQPHEIFGRVLIEAADGGLLVEERQGRLWTIDKPQLKARSSTGEQYHPLTIDELARQLPQELGPGFEAITTKHYIVCGNAGREYAEWTALLFERLYAAFQNYWKQRGVRLREPEFPLVAIVFANQQQFAEFATRDAGPDAATAKGYYSIASNRMVMYDLASASGRQRGDIARKLASAPYNVATLVHEATHQIAFNSGLHTRYADNPLWLTEGMAMFFETPDLKNRSGWRTVGAVNPLRLRQFRDYARSRRPANSLQTLLGSDARFLDAEQMADAYAEAWTLTHFLIRTRKQEYVKYLTKVAEKSRLVWDTPEERLAEFQAVFGDDLQKLDRDLLRYLQKL